MSIQDQRGASKRGDYFDRRQAERTTRRATQLLERQGERVTLDAAA